MSDDKDFINLKQVVVRGEGLTVKDGVKFGFGFGLGIFIWVVVLFAAIATVSIIAGGVLLEDFKSDFNLNNIWGTNNATPRVSEQFRVEPKSTLQSKLLESDKSNIQKSILDSQAEYEAEIKKKLQE